MSGQNVLVSGTPRSGTTLTCHLLNKLPNTVALHEPIGGRYFARVSSLDKIAGAVQRFSAMQRDSILSGRVATSKQLDGVVRDNPFGDRRSATGLRQQIDAKGEITIDKELSPDFMLVLKHTSAFAALLDQLAPQFPVFAIVRNPLATLASWQTVDIPIQDGRAPSAERLYPGLGARLDAISDTVDRQIHLLGWFYEQFRRNLDERAIIHYETIVDSGGQALTSIQPEASSLREPLECQNKSSLYDHSKMQLIGERLLTTDGAFWELHTRASVEQLLNELATGAAQKRD